MTSHTIINRTPSTTPSANRAANEMDVDRGNDENASDDAVGENQASPMAGQNESLPQGNDDAAPDGGSSADMDVATS